MTKRPLFLAAALAALVTAMPVSAELQQGAKAPEFKATGAQAGKPITFDLAQTLKKGPVVLYFFPAAFTPGCNIEAAAFAQAIPDFRAAGATVIGVTAGNTDQLADFSGKHCAGQFAVAAATPKIRDDYQVALPNNPNGWTSRTTYVIDKHGKIVMAYSAMQPNEHITRSLAAVRALKRG